MGELQDQAARWRRSRFFPHRLEARAARGVLAVWLLAPGMAVEANDFPTLDRVDQVLTCMRGHGGQTLDNLYACSCAVDAVAAALSYDDFVEATTFKGFKSMPGERGGLFRESARGQKLVERLEEAEERAARSCFVGVARSKRPVAPPPAAPPPAAPPPAAPPPVIPPPVIK
ncbi:MAG: hypothetical protein ACT4QB_16285 [Gammaproteobacteria bacterium]